MERPVKRKNSDDLRTSGENSDPVPLDVIPAILKGLPVKTLARFLCVSKQWESIIRNRDFIKSYLIKPSTRPQGLLFTCESKHYGKRFFFSARHPQNPGESSSSSSLAIYHMACRSKPYTTVAPSVHGLICHGHPSKLMVYNPSTRRTITLPKIDSQRLDMYHYLGYDPIDGDYNVLCMTCGMHLLRGRRFSSRDSPDICIDGVLYYRTCFEVDDEDLSPAVMRFDVRSESFFDLIKVPHGGGTRPKLTNYQGKLAILFHGDSTQINLWVLEDAVKHEWSKKFYVLPTIEGQRQSYDFVHSFCVTNAGEFVYAYENMLAKTFYVLYYDPKKNTVRRVGIEGILELKWKWKVRSQDSLSVFSGQVDNLMFL